MDIEKNYSAHTILNYKLDLEGFNKFITGTDLEKIDYLTLRKYLAVLKEKNLGNRTVGRRLSSLRSFFRFLTRESYIKANPMLMLSSPKLERHLPSFMTEDEVYKLIESAFAKDKDDLLGLRDRAILEAFYSSGLRIS